MQCKLKGMNGKICSPVLTIKAFHAHAEQSKPRPGQAESFNLYHTGKHSNMISGFFMQCI